MARHVMRVGDLLPIIGTTTTEANGTVYDLTGHTAILRYWRKDGTGTYTERAATITSASAGTIEYTWISADVATEGEFWCIWVVTNGAGKKRSFPASDPPDELIINKNGTE